MKHFLTHLGPVLTAAGLSLLALGCGDKDAKDGKDGADGKDGKAGGADLEAQMVGYWSADKEAMLAMLQKEAADDPTAAAFLPMITAMIDNMAVEVTKDEVTMVGMGDAQTSTYKVKSKDTATKTITMEVTSDGDVEEGSATIDGDRLTLKKGGGDDSDTIILNRITKEQFDKKKEAAAAAGIPGFPGGTPTPTPTPPIPTPTPTPLPTIPDPSPEPEPAPEPEPEPEPAPEPEPEPTPEPEPDSSGN